MRDMQEHILQGAGIIKMILLKKRKAKNILKIIMLNPGPVIIGTKVENLIKKYFTDIEIKTITDGDLQKTTLQKINSWDSKSNPLDDLKIAYDRIKNI
jgi:hypothetical protein